MIQNNRILVVDDDPAIHAAFRVILQRKDKANPFKVDSAKDGTEGLQLVQLGLDAAQPYALAFVDLRISRDCDGIETVARMWEAQPDLQVVICTGYSDYSWDELLQRFGRLGRLDNLLILKKPFDNVEVLQLANALTRKWQVTHQAAMRLEEVEAMVRQRTDELQAAHHQLLNSEERFSKAFHASPIPVAIHTLRDRRIADVNSAFLRMTGFTAGDLMGRSIGELDAHADLENHAWPMLAAHKHARNIQCQITASKGEPRQTLVSLEILDLSGEPHVLMIAEDITDRRKLESDLRQAQKMEAVGQLAAGVAHDFNNALTIIQGHASLHISDPVTDPEVVESLTHITAAAERAARLTRQLLAFSRKQVMKQRRLDLNAMVEQIGGVLPRLIGEHIRLEMELEPTLPAIFADDCNVEQILLNLAVNARDAMPCGGTIVIRTTEVEIGEDYVRETPEATRGHYICLAVSDTGTGMDLETRSHLFEPFFTTKDVGQGTGMGLATIYGIVKQHDGWVEVESETGKGSIFRIYLPLAEGRSSAIALPVGARRTNGAGRLVLVVEDDPEVRFLVKGILEHHDYHVIEAADGQEALLLARRHLHEIALLLTDMVMPRGVSGRDLAQSLLAERPGLKVIYTSGYSPDLFDPSLNLVEGVNYLPKPYSSGTLANILHATLEIHEDIARIS